MPVSMRTYKTNISQFPHLWKLWLAVGVVAIVGACGMVGASIAKGSLLVGCMSAPVFVIGALNIANCVIARRASVQT